MRTTSFFLLLILCLALSATAFAGTIYDNGPTNGTLIALYIDGPGGPLGQSISDGFVASTSGTASNLDFAEWVPEGAYPTAVAWSLGTTSFGGDIASGNASVGARNMTSIQLCSSGNPFNGGVCGGGYGYDVYISEGSGLSGLLVGGNTYYLTLNGATDSAGALDAWDENDGPATCYFENYSGSGLCEPYGFGSESFTITTATTGPPPTTPEPSSILLFGSGILGLVGVLRRKLNR
jgi:hypothetical protein